MQKSMLQLYRRVNAVIKKDHNAKALFKRFDQRCCVQVKKTKTDIGDVLSPPLTLLATYCLSERLMKRCDMIACGLLRNQPKSSEDVLRKETRQFMTRLMSTDDKPTLNDFSAVLSMIQDQECSNAIAVKVGNDKLFVVARAEGYFVEFSYFTEEKEIHERTAVSGPAGDIIYERIWVRELSIWSRIKSYVLPFLKDKFEWELQRECSNDTE